MPNSSTFPIRHNNKATMSLSLPENATDLYALEGKMFVRIDHIDENLGIIAGAFMEQLGGAGGTPRAIEIRKGFFDLVMLKQG